jgi:hypothetical protein
MSERKVAASRLLWPAPFGHYNDADDDHVFRPLPARRWFRLGGKTMTTDQGLPPLTAMVPMNCYVLGSRDRMSW